MQRVHQCTCNNTRASSHIILVFAQSEHNLHHVYEVFSLCDDLKMLLFEFSVALTVFQFSFFPKKSSIARCCATYSQYVRKCNLRNWKNGSVQRSNSNHRIFEENAFNVLINPNMVSCPCTWTMTTVHFVIRSLINDSSESNRTTTTM